MKKHTIVNMMRAAFQRFALAIAVVAGVGVGCVNALTTTQTYTLATSPAKTTIFPGVGGLLPWISKGSLPPGSILRRVSVNARIESATTDDWASDLNVYFDSLPSAPGTAARLQVGGYGTMGTVALALTDLGNNGWANGQGGPPTTVIDTKLAVAWAATGAVDLNTVEVSIGNDYNEAAWSGTITIEYDVPELALMLSFGPNAAIDDGSKTIEWTVPFGSDVTTLAPTFTLSSGSCDKTSGGSYDFTNPVVYTVTDGATTNAYTVNVTVAPDETTLLWDKSAGEWNFSSLNWKGQTSGVTTSFFNGKNVIFNKTSGGLVNIESAVAPLTTTVSATSGDYTFSGQPITSGSLTKSGDGKLIMRIVNNSYSGGTIITGGTLDIGLEANAALGTGPVTLNGGTLFLFRVHPVNPLIINGGTFLSENGFGNSWNGNITLNSNFNCDVYYPCNITGNISGAGGLNKNIGVLFGNDARLTLSGNNTYTGATSVFAGTLALVGGSQASPVTVSAGASLGFTLGSPTTSTSTFNLSAGTIKIAGTPTLASYDLIASSAGITGTPVLDAAISGYELKVTGNKLVLQKIGYSAWASLNGATADRSADHDNDGVSNGIEFFIGGPSGNTTGFTALPPIVQELDGTYSVTWTKAASYIGAYGIDYVVETSSTLSGVWAPESSPGAVVVTATTVKFTFPTPYSGKNFARLKVTGP